MPFYPADYLADTGHLTTLEHGAYFLLILHYWSNGGLPKDETKLARIARLTASEWTSVRDTIADFFDGNWQHFRIDAELATARERHEGRAAAGAKGGRASWAKRKSKPRFGNASAGLNQPQPQPYSEANASDACASPRDRLWKEGLPALIALGVKEKQARPMVGRWLKDCGDDETRLCDLILRARAEAPIEPIAWITASLTKEKKRAATENLSTVARRLATDEWIDFGPKPGSSGAVRREEDGDAVRLLPEGGRK
jgi:uncharacterized protein YdaU (DUF1376 family)